MSELADPFRYDDAAYVLGALDDIERAAFEAHLESCRQCQARVAEARAGHELLAGLQLSDVEDAAPMPDTLLPGLLRAAKRERSRTRWLTSSLGAVAAAAIAALVVVLWPSGSGTSGPAPEAMHPVGARQAPVAATAKLVSKAWGTEIQLKCRYSDNAERYAPYSLVIVDDRNNKYEAGSWTLAPGTTTTFTGGTAVHLSDIAKVEITLENGKPILALQT